MAPDLRARAASACSPASSSRPSWSPSRRLPRGPTASSRPPPGAAPSARNGDGFDDTVGISYYLSEPANVDIEILGAGGAVINSVGNYLDGGDDNDGCSYGPLKPNGRQGDTLISCEYITGSALAASATADGIATLALLPGVIAIRPRRRRRRWASALGQTAG